MTPSARLRCRPNKVPFGGATDGNAARAIARGHTKGRTRARERRRTRRSRRRRRWQRRRWQRWHCLRAPSNLAWRRAQARRRRRGCSAALGWAVGALIPGAPLAQSRACHAERHGDGRCRPRRLQPRRPERHPERAWAVAAAVGAAVGRLRRGKFSRRPSRPRPQRRQRAAATSCSAVAALGYLGGGGGGGGNGGGGGGGGGGGFFGQRCGTLQGLRMSGIPMKNISTGGMTSISQSNLELEMQQLADLSVWWTLCSSEDVGTSDWFNSTLPMPAPSRRRHARCPIRAHRGAGCSVSAP